MNLYTKHIAPVAETYAYCLLRNHFHILVRIREIPETLRVLETLRVSSKVSQGFSNFFNAYAKAINKAYGRTGSLFQHPFGRVPVTHKNQFYRVVMYIHQNPQKHKFVEDFRDWKYSSYGVLLSDSQTFLERHSIMEWFTDPSGFAALHQEWIGDRESASFAGDD
jgi:hypothetical protein